MISSKNTFPVERFCELCSLGIVRFFLRIVISLKACIGLITTILQPFNAMHPHDIIVSLI
jgi:hypothetical protein